MLQKCGVIVLAAIRKLLSTGSGSENKNKTRSLCAHHILSLHKHSSSNASRRVYTGCHQISCRRSNHQLPVQEKSQLSLSSRSGQVHSKALQCFNLLPLDKIYKLSEEETFRCKWVLITFRSFVSSAATQLQNLNNKSPLSSVWCFFIGQTQLEHSWKLHSLSKTASLCSVWQGEPGADNITPGAKGEPGNPGLPVRNITDTLTSVQG